jgi:tetrahydromethanopterin S-methyltransferase subunit G
MTIQELVEEMNQFIEDDERKLRVPSETTPVALQAASFVKRMRRRLDALEKRLSMAATRYFARAGK